jgi:hypothetical protein
MIFVMKSIFTRTWQAALDKKKADEAEHAENAKKQAVAELESWKQQQTIKLNAKKDSNRSEEQVLLETIESEADAGTWDRVTKLIDASAESVETGKSDVTRMRKLFIQLKNEPLEKTRAQVAQA